MSGFNAYLSFANYLSDQLAGDGITVVLEKTEDLTPPYLIMQDGPDKLTGWLSSRMVQGWLVVKRQANEDLARTIGIATDKVLRATQVTGNLIKYDYSTNPVTDMGTYIPTIFEVSQLFPTNDDDNLMRRVITWELHSNCK